MSKVSSSMKRRVKQRAKKGHPPPAVTAPVIPPAAQTQPSNTTVEWVAQTIDLESIPEDLREVMLHFERGGPVDDADEDINGDASGMLPVTAKNNGNGDSDMETGIDGDDDDDDEDLDNPKSTDPLSKKKQRKLAQMSVADLKRLVNDPSVVEWIDVTSTDPKLLVYLKSYRNSVPVPLHWQQKRKYLQGKRGIEKRPFELPGLFYFCLFFWACP